MEVKYGEEQDEYLMYLFTQGDDEAFNEIVRRYTPRLYSYIYKYINDEERAREITQEVFIRVFRARDRYSVKAKFSTFIYRIALNLAYNEVRDRGRRKTDVSDDFSRIRSDERQDPEKLAVAEDVKDQIWEKINQLEPKYRDVLILCDIENLSYKETGKVLKISVGTVQSRLSRARMKLRKELAHLFE